MLIWASGKAWVAKEPLRNGSRFSVDISTRSGSESRLVKRDAAYYRERLRREFPEVFEDLEKGVYRSVHAAALAAGLIRKRTRLTELKNAWSKATAAERKEFEDWVRAGTTAPKSTAPRSSVDAEGRLLPWSKKRLDEIEAHRRLKPGEIMKELGFAALNPSLQSARWHNTKITKDLTSALDDWLHRHST